APAKIPVVYEPLLTVSQPVTAGPDKAGKRPKAEEVLQSILVRVPPQYVPGKGRSPITALTGLEIYRGAYAVVDPSLLEIESLDDPKLVERRELKELVVKLAQGWGRLPEEGEKKLRDLATSYLRSGTPEQRLRMQREINEYFR